MPPIDAIRRGLADAQIVGLYLYGSAVAGGLRPDSDLDLFVVTDRRLIGGSRKRGSSRACCRSRVAGPDRRHGGRSR